MTQPQMVRDNDWSRWVLQTDGTYRVESSPGSWSDLYQGYTLQRIEDEFGIMSKDYGDGHGERDYSFLRSRW